MTECTPVSIQRQFYHFQDIVFVCLYFPQRKFESGSYSFKLRLCNASQMRPKLYNFGNLLFELQVDSFNASIQIAYYVLELVTVIYNHRKPIMTVTGGTVGCCIDYIRCREWRQNCPRDNSRFSITDATQLGFRQTHVLRLITWSSLFEIIGKSSFCMLYK